MRTVGLLLVSALMVVPVAAARNLVRGFLAALVCAIIVGVFVSVGGAVGSFYADAAPGAFIVLLAIAVFALSWPAGAILRRRHRPVPVLPAAMDDDDLVALHVVVTEGHPHRTIRAAATGRSSTATTPTSSTRGTAMPPTPTTTTSTDRDDLT